MSEPEASATGPAGSLRRMADSFLALFETRLQLFAVELQCEKLRAVELLLVLALATAVGLVGLLLAVATLAIYLWEVSRFAGLVALALVFLTAAGFLLWRVRVRIRQQPMPFADSLAEFRKDRSCLQGRN